MHRKTALSIEADEPGLPFAHLITSPALHTALVDGKGRVGDDQFLVYTHNLAKTLALGACTDGRVESKELVGGFLKDDTICLEFGIKGVHDAGRVETKHHFSATLVEGCLHTVSQSGNTIAVIAHSQTVYYEENLVDVNLGRVGKEFLYGSNLSTNLYANETLLEIFFQTFLHIIFGLFLADVHWCKHSETGARSV